MHQLGEFPKTRLRRLRQHPVSRGFISETQLNANRFIAPLFIHHGKNIRHPIHSMPGCSQLSIDQLDAEIQSLMAVGIESVLLFGIPETKDPLGQTAYHDEGVIQSAISYIKQHFPKLFVISDVCFCEYTDHGHCGVMTNGYLDNDHTLELLQKQAVSHAKAGVDMVAPSGMIDGMVASIRRGLDDAGFSSLPILSYAVKYASALYGPFRDAAEGAPKSGDRKSHQMDYSNVQEALRECALDIAEGADMLMVKPAHTYLDVIQRVKHAYPSLPLCAYHTSGEYAMLKAASEKGWIDEQKTVIEVLTAIRRAGADLIITYYAKEIAEYLGCIDNSLLTY